MLTTLTREAPTVPVELPALRRRHVRHGGPSFVSIILVLVLAAMAGAILGIFVALLKLPSTATPPAGSAGPSTATSAPIASGAVPSVKLTAPAVPARPVNPRRDGPTSRPVFYADCSQAPGPIQIGQPGYRPALDADHDGIACEARERTRIVLVGVTHTVTVSATPTAPDPPTTSDPPPTNQCPFAADPATGTLVQGVWKQVDGSWLCTWPWAPHGM